MASFEETFAKGGWYEEFCVLDLRKKTQPNAFQNIIKENFSYYDIVLPDIDKTIECKYDDRALESGNICIETGCNGRLSGILITKADYWLITDGITAYLIEYQKIRQCINENSSLDYRSNYRVDQGKNEYKEMNFFLIPKRIFVKYCLEVGDVYNMKYDKLV